MCICVIVYLCMCVPTCVQASVILCGQCVGTWRLLAAKCRLRAWDLCSVWSTYCGEFDVVRVARRVCFKWAACDPIQLMWTNVLEVRAIETHWTNMVHWEDLARVSRLLEVRAIHCLRCGRRRTRVSRVCFKRGGSVSSVAPKQLPLVQGSDQFLNRQVFLSQVSQWWKSSSKSHNSQLKVYGITWSISCLPPDSTNSDPYFCLAEFDVWSTKFSNSVWFCDY